MSKLKTNAMERSSVVPVRYTPCSSATTTRRPTLPPTAGGSTEGTARCNASKLAASVSQKTDQATSGIQRGRTGKPRR